MVAELGLANRGSRRLIRYGIQKAACGREESILLANNERSPLPLYQGGRGWEAWLRQSEKYGFRPRRGFPHPLMMASVRATVRAVLDFIMSQSCGFDRVFSSRSGITQLLFFRLVSDSSLVDINLKLDKRHLEGCFHLFPHQKPRAGIRGHHTYFSGAFVEAFGPGFWRPHDLPRADSSRAMKSSSPNGLPVGS